jgi:hypothetical protein
LFGRAEPTADARGGHLPADRIHVRRFVTHSYRAANLAVRQGWLPGARYTNLRDVRRFDRLGFLDIDWRNYNFARHVEAARATRPMLTVGRDIEDIENLERTLDEGRALLDYADGVIIVPKDPRLGEALEELIPAGFILGYSVPTRYGGTTLPLRAFRRPVHLLGGRPDVQRRLAQTLPVVSIDCNRFTLDASYGDYFDGTLFRPHPVGGYERCIEASVANINRLWRGYRTGDGQRR